MMHRSLMVSFALGVAAPLGAQEHRDTVRLSPVVVTATRLPTPVTSLAATVTVLEGEELQARGVRDVADALREVPGVAIVRSGSYGALTSAFVRGGESNYVKVLVDGVPINDPGGAVDLATLTTDNVDRIEIVRGPASVLYGSDAVAGVVHILTRRGAGAARGHVGVSGGTFGTVAAEAGFSGGVEAVSYGVGFARTRTDGILAFNNQFHHTVLSGSVRARPDARTDAALSVRYTDGAFHFPTDGAGNVVDRNAFRFQERLAGALEAGRFLTDRLEGRVLLTLNDTDAGIDDRPDGPADTLGFFAFQSVQALARRGADGRLNLHLGGGHVVTVGAHLEEQRERSFNQSQSEFGSSTGSLDVERANRGYYAQLHARPAADLALTGGVRLDDNDAFGTFVTYRVGATYRVPSGTRLRGSVGTAFKEPTFFENFAASPFARGNPDLVPERSTTWELGAEQTFAAGRARLGATFFSQQFRDLIQFTFAPPSPGDPNFFNVAAADARGVELEAQAVAAPGLTLSASYTYLDTEVQDAGFDAGPAGEFVQGERLLRRPTHTLAAGVAYRVAGRARLAANLRYVGTRDDVDFAVFERAALPAYATLDVAAETDVVRAGARRLAVTLRIANLLDETYEEVFNFPAPGRAVSVGVRGVF